MTVMEFFGCSFIAFGLPVAMFIFTIARDPLRVIILMASAFFWLLSLLLSSILWYAVVPLRDKIAFGLVFSVIFQEGFRLLFYVILKKADAGLATVAERESGTGTSIIKNKHLMAYVVGLGFGLVSGAFSLVNVLADMTGPGTIGINGHNSSFFIVSAFLTLCFILLHVCWGVIFYAGLEHKRYYIPVIVTLSHMLVSCLTLLNQGKDPVYAATLSVAYGMLVIMGGWAFIVAGGSTKNLKAFCSPATIDYNMSRS